VAGQMRFGCHPRRGQPPWRARSRRVGTEPSKSAAPRGALHQRAGLSPARAVEDAHTSDAAGG
jgi:hypothetical protein